MFRHWLKQHGKPEPPFTDIRWFGTPIRTPIIWKVWLRQRLFQEVPNQPPAIAKQDFETGDASNYEYNNTGSKSFTAVQVLLKGRYWKFQCRSKNKWNGTASFSKFALAMKSYEKYILRMDVRLDDLATFATQAHVVPYQYKHWDFLEAYLQQVRGLEFCERNNCFWQMLNHRNHCFLTLVKQLRATTWQY